MAFATSWPDEYARRLELLYVRTHLPSDVKRVVEIGCGNFGLAEDPAIPGKLKGKYVGLDGSLVALDAAARRAGPGFEFLQKDLTEGELPAGDFILSKRTLQNITPSSRRGLLEKVLAFPHGLLIEDLNWARHETDRLRAAVGREALAVPEFNYPLTFKEFPTSRLSLAGDIRNEAFMGWFYAITRVFPDLPRAGFEAGFALSQRAILAGERQPFYGPVIALSW